MIYSHSISVALPPERAMHLFTPIGERLWAAHWDPRFPAGERGDGSAPGTVFLTGDTHWVVIDRAPGRVRYARVTPGVRAGTVEVALRADGEATIADVTYDITPLVEGDDYDPAIHAWEPALAAAIALTGGAAARSRIGGRGQCSARTRRSQMRTPLLSAVALAAALAAAPPAMANVPLTQVSADPYTNSTSQHATEVEPAPSPPRRRGIP